MIQSTSFGSLNFSHAQLGDIRRTRRLMALADQIVARPGGTLPQKFRAPADLQAFYRLMDCEQVTHQAIVQAHRLATLERVRDISVPILIIHDSTELDFTNHRSLEDLGRIGCGTRRGYIVHNSLAIRADTHEPLGLVNQILHRRATVSDGETRTQRHHREDRESRLWLEANQALDSFKQGIDICDRGADTFEFLQYQLRAERQFVIRSGHDRRIIIGHGTDEGERQLHNLHRYLRSLEPLGTWSLEVTSKTELQRGRGHHKKKLISRKSRIAQMAVSAAAVQIRPSRIAGAKFIDSLSLWCLRVWEIGTPEGQVPMEWMLLSNIPITSFQKAYQIVGWYECRWIIEEYHKGMKSGSRIESLQFTCEDRLQPAIALLSITTLCLLQLRDASRRPDAKQRLARDIVDKSFVDILSLWRHKQIRDNWTVHDFYYALARLGGHQNRKSDHPPGWQVLWEGWKELLPMSIGYNAAKSNQQKCDKT